MNKSGQLEDIRKSSRGIVLSSIRELGRVARIDIAERTGISQARVTGISAELLEAGLIEEIAREDNSGDLKRGRPRVDLKIRGAARMVAGVKLGDKNATVAILDFGGNMVGEFMLELPKTKLNSQEALDFLFTVLLEATKSTGIALSDLSGVGFGLAGVIDVPRGFVHWSPSLTQRNLPLRELLEKRLGLPVFLDNDVNLVALAEQWFGLGKGVSDFIVITIENGVGMGIVINGEIYRGTRGCGAEFGHTKVQLDGALCRCGQRGCLEAYVADYALLREANYAQDSSLSPNAEQQVQSLFMQAKGGDQTA
ncbi:MAG TPA: ROK family transcriptional regulator, partial [Devosia sp.]|nr:ROK family transcriptional regulator [Devosia sp.]